MPAHSASESSAAVTAATHAAESPAVSTSAAASASSTTASAALPAVEVANIEVSVPSSTVVRVDASTGKAIPAPPTRYSIHRKASTGRVRFADMPEEEAATQS